MEGNVMKTINRNAVVAGLLGAGALLMSPMTAFAAEPGQGWDTFNTGDGERITVSAATAYMGTSLPTAVGKGWDTFNVGDGQGLPASNLDFKRASPAPSASEGIDINGHFNYGY
jgi:hypothetical protein